MSRCRDSLQRTTGTWRVKHPPHPTPSLPAPCSAGLSCLESLGSVRALLPDGQQLQERRR